MEFLRSRAWFGSKRAVQRRLRRMGIEVRKFPSAPFTPVPVFDLAVRLLMEKQGTSLSFVQVGANDGVFGDPLRRFVTANPWRGILIEPQPEVFARLVENYQDCAGRLRFENVAISVGGADLILYKAPRGLLSDEVYASSIASSDAATIARQLRIAEARLEKIVTPSTTLDALLQKHGMSGVQVVQIDVEGHDWQVLRTLDLNKTAPAIIQFETGHLSNADCNNAVVHLSKFGYDIHWGGYQGDAVALKSAVFA